MAMKVSVKEATNPPVEKATGGAYEGANRFSRELATWHPPLRSADQEINRDKPLADSRSLDLIRNEGYIRGSIATRKDSIVGGRYSLNAQPDYEALGATAEWAEEFQRVVESQFSLWAESPENWPDASRQNTFTELVRLAVGLSAASGEVLATVEWIRSAAYRRPFNTAIQMVDPARLSNPYNQSDTKYLRGGVEQDKHGAPIAYHIRTRHPAEAFADGYDWKRVPARKPWGRLQVIHLFEQMRPSQSRGISEMVAVLKEMKMTKQYRDIVLQNAVVNATYAMAIESELPSEMLYEQLGTEGSESAIGRYLSQLSEYVEEAGGLHIDGVKIPHLFPGTKLHMKNAGTPGGVGTGFEEGLLRHIAASLGLSYEQFSKDYTKTNYSSARASMNETWKFMQAQKKLNADKFATAGYSLWLEEAINKGVIPLPPGKDASHFYEGLNKEAYCRCEWIGASRGQIDELKETQAAILRIKACLSTYEDEIARGGKDFRRVFEQRAREEGIIKKRGLSPNLDSQAPQAEADAEAAGESANDRSDKQETAEQEDDL